MAELLVSVQTISHNEASTIWNKAGKRFTRGRGRHTGTVYPLPNREFLLVRPSQMFPKSRFDIFILTREKRSHCSQDLVIDIEDLDKVVNMVHRQPDFRFPGARLIFVSGLGLSNFSSGLFLDQHQNSRGRLSRLGRWSSGLRGRLLTGWCCMFLLCSILRSWIILGLCGRRGGSCRGRRVHLLQIIGNYRSNDSIVISTLWRIIGRLQSRRQGIRGGWLFRLSRMLLCMIIIGVLR